MLDYCCALHGFDQDGLRGSSIDMLDNPMVMDLTQDVGFILAVNAILRLRPSSVLIVALSCDSFSIVPLVVDLFFLYGLRFTWP